MFLPGLPDGDVQLLREIIFFICGKKSGFQKETDFFRDNPFETGVFEEITLDGRIRIGCGGRSDASFHVACSYVVRRGPHRNTRKVQTSSAVMEQSTIFRLVLRDFSTRRCFFQKKSKKRLLQNLIGMCNSLVSRLNGLKT
jgi:hypothetical protein